MLRGSLVAELVKPDYRKETGGKQACFEIRVCRRFNYRGELLLKRLVSQDASGPEIISSDEYCRNSCEEEAQIDVLVRLFDLGLLEDLDSKTVCRSSHSRYQPVLT